ncbi:MAG: ABC transporter substrate-binding protein [Clostridia bacterium]|nr:ABC transporter substrate-binding protein [Clostridia bacterium]
MKKILSLIISAVLILGLTACGTASATYTIGILEYSSHEAQSLAVQGFIDVLTEKLGTDVAFDRQHASGDANSATLIANNFVTKNVDLILADNTQSLQIASSATAVTPVLGAAVTDYAHALDLGPGNSATGINVSGTSDLATIEAQADMILELFPGIDKVAILYCSSEVNSEYQASKMVSYLFQKGVLCNEFIFTDSNDLASLVGSACDAGYKVIFTPTDNTVAECAQIVDNICRERKVAVITGEKGICKACGLATLSIDYYALGRKTGEMAYKILVEGADITQMPIEYDENCTKLYNAEIAQALGANIPEDYIPIE